ncbi:GATA transcription factor 26 [Apostasia shenzhenica]|uniref:GATA transcription factor 26 n=1 Tax=Apostasia shenzhenica TaxID=1088818 RepID=A0A2I0A417_9ASPA|nr:GATA transcription factor 26 [Apostasia shenzhenica]
MVESEHEIPFSVSDQNYIKASEADASNRSSSGSAVSYTESCANFGNTDASDWTGSAQSNAWDSLVPSKKRSLIRLKPSPVEKLTKELYSIWHEQQSSNLSRSSDDDLLYDGETPIGSVEIGNGGVLLRYPCSKTVEEESEASSLPLDSSLVNDAYSRHEYFPVDSEMKRTSFSSDGKEKLKKSGANWPQEYYKQDIVSFENFVNHLSFEEQQRLMQYLPSVDISQPPESLKSMFSSTQLVESLSYFQQLLQEGIFDLSFCQMHVEECRNLKRLVLLNLTKSRWVEHYKQLKEVDDFVDNEGSCFSPRSLFASPPDRCSMLRLEDDTGSDHDLLLDVRCGASFPDAELLEFHPCFQKAVSKSSLAESAISAAEESLCNFSASSLSSLQLKKRQVT